MVAGSGTACWAKLTLSIPMFQLLPHSIVIEVLETMLGE